MECYYTDGSASGNPGPGGFSAVYIKDDEQPLVMWKEGPSCTTNNAMELMGVILALEHICDNVRPREVTIYSDSTYVIGGIVRELTWASRTNLPNKAAWVTAWNLYTELSACGIRLTFEHVSAHSGIPYNEVADTAAKLGAQLSLANKKAGI